MLVFSLTTQVVRFQDQIQNQVFQVHQVLVQDRHIVRHHKWSFWNPNDLESVMISKLYLDSNQVHVPLFHRFQMESLMRLVLLNFFKVSTRFI